MERDGCILMTLYNVAKFKERIMKKLIIAVVLIGVAIGAAFLYEQQETLHEIAAKRAPLLASLKDADSAKFRNEHSVSGTPYLCGEVNSKNTMGAYVGFTRYISYPSGYAIKGYSIESFDANAASASEAIQSVIKTVEFKNMELRKVIENAKTARKAGLNYQIPNDQEIQERANLDAFQDLWNQHC